MKIKSLFLAICAAAFAFSACDDPNKGLTKGFGNPYDVPKFDFPFYEDFPIEVGNTFIEGSEAGVSILLKKIEEQNFVFELRPGPMVQSFKFDVYPLAGLYNTILNTYNADNLPKGDPIAINELIREMLFVDGSGGYAFSVNDFENPADFLQIEYDGMSTVYSANCPAIPQCGYIIAVVASADPDISSANQEDLTLCYLQTTSKPLVGSPSVEIEVRTGYRAFEVKHYPNADAAGYYYFGGMADEIDDYINHFGDTMYRDFMRTLYNAPSTEDGLSYSKNYGDAADHTIKSVTTAVAVDVNGTPQEGYERQDFTLKEMPAEEEQELDVPKLIFDPNRIAAAYIDFEAIIPKTCDAIFYGFYTPEQKQALETADALTQKFEMVKLMQEGWAAKNENFVWDDNRPDGEKATGAQQKVLLEGWGEQCFRPGATLYVGYVARNGYGTPTPLTFSEPFTLDQRNLSSPDNCNVKDLKQWVTKVTRTSFRHNWSYDPANVSLVYMTYMTPENKPEGLTTESPWQDWANFIFTPNSAEYSVNTNFNVLRNSPAGEDFYGWTGMTPNTRHTLIICAEDFEGNVSQIVFTDVRTNEVKVGPDPTVNMELAVDQKHGGWDVVFTIDHDVNNYKVASTTSINDLNIKGATQAALDDLVKSGISYEEWNTAIYSWVEELGMETDYESTYIDIESTDTHIVACLAQGEDKDGNLVFKMNHLIVRDGKAQTLEEIFGIK